MSDPFSATGSAIGVISLGLAVCEGLLAYYWPYKTFHEEIDDIICRTESLTKALRALEKILSDAEKSDMTQKAESAKIAIETIKYCEQRLKRLEGMLKKCCKVTPPQGLFKTKPRIDRMIYPFRRDTLMALVEVLNGLQNNLNTALQVLSYAMMNINEQRMEVVMSNSASAASETGQALDVVRDLSQKDGDIEKKLDSIESRLIQTTSIVRHQTQPMLSPALLRLLLDNQHEVDADINRAALNIPSGLNGPTRKRTCLGNSVATVPIRQSGLFQHSYRDGCPFRTSKRLASISAQHVFCNWLLKCSITISLEITQGAGGLSIAPGLKFRAIVPEDSAAFKFLAAKQRILYKSWLRHEYLEVDDTLHDTSQFLLEMFQAGRASPADALPNGDTLLHVIARWHRLTRFWSPTLQIQWRRLIKFLLNNCALPNIVNNNGETPVDIIMQSMWLCCLGTSMEQCSIDICSDLVSAGGYMTSIGIFKCRQLGFYSHELGNVSNRLIPSMSFRVVQRVAAKIGFECSELPEHFYPVLSKSETDLGDLLKGGTNMNEVMDYYAQWPGGLALLVRSGLVPSYGTLAAAFAANCKESIKLLLRAKSFCICPIWLHIVSSSHDHEILELAVQEIASRRKRLQIMAQTYLPGEELSRLRIQPGHLLDSTAGYACRLLNAVSVDIGFAESEISWLVYCQTGSNMTMADLLWKAGFRNVNERDGYDYTSLMKLDDNRVPVDGPIALLKKAQWLITRGADPHRTRKGSPAVFYICYDLGIATYCHVGDINLGLEFQQMSDQCLELMRRMLFDPYRDTCNCSYSLDGCSSLSRYLDGFFSRVHYDKSENVIFRRLATALDAIASALCPSCPWNILDSMAPDVLSFIISQALHITHTCACNMHGEDSRTTCQSSAADEIVELSFVEDHLLQRHEDLLDEFLIEYKERAEPLPGFITGYWSTRMSQALSFDEISYDEQGRKLREIGVILSHPIDSDGPDDFI